MKKALTLVLAGVTSMGMALSALADGYITLASTTSTQNSGLFDAILPQFEDATGIDVRVVAVGTGQAFEIARRGDADSLLVHDTAGETALCRERLCQRAGRCHVQRFRVDWPHRRSGEYW